MAYVSQLMINAEHQILPIFVPAVTLVMILSMEIAFMVLPTLRVFQMLAVKYGIGIIISVHNAHSSGHLIEMEFVHSFQPFVLHSIKTNAQVASEDMI